MENFYLQNFTELVFLYYYAKFDHQLAIFRMKLNQFFVIIEFKKFRFHFLITLFYNCNLIC